MTGGGCADDRGACLVVDQARKRATTQHYINV